jgi:hypothetical protein
MTKRSSRITWRAPKYLVALGLLGAVMVPAAGAGEATSVGRFTTLSGGSDAGLDIGGVALLRRGATSTTGRVVVTGLEPGVTYAAHLHSQPCDATNPGGGHYTNVVGAGAAPPNELWFSSSADPTDGITANRGGVAIGRGSADWVARADARAVVIHAIPAGGTTAGGPKIACADLG